MNYHDKNINDVINLGIYTIEYLEEEILALDLGNAIDVDRASEDTLELSCILGVYIINVHKAANQLWLSSPMSGAYHFNYDNGVWIDSRSYTLDEILNQELQSLISGLKLPRCYSVTNN